MRFNMVTCHSECVIVNAWESRTWTDFCGIVLFGFWMQIFQLQTGIGSFVGIILTIANCES